MVKISALIARYSTKGIIIDTNILLLYLVGSVNRERIPKFHLFLCLAQRRSPKGLAAASGAEKRGDRKYYFMGTLNIELLF